ncbi:hypothetical protein ACTA71_003194 [Dictyostelium dimigraforme]
MNFCFSQIIENEQCQLIKKQNLIQPRSLFISYYKNNNVRIDFIKLENNSKSFQVFQSNQNILHGIEFLSITSNSSILVKSNNEYSEQLQCGNSSFKSFSFKWDNELYKPYYTIDQCLNKSIDLSAGKITAMVVSGSGNFSILNGHIIGNEKQFEYQSNVKVVNEDLQSFKSSFDIENNIHYSLIYDKNKNNDNSNIYLIITNLNILGNDSKEIKPDITTTTTTISINIPNMELKSMGISGYNNTIIIAGFDNKSNSTKIYSVNVLYGNLNNNNANKTNNINNNTDINTNNSKNINLNNNIATNASNNNNLLQSNITLLFEKNITISNYVKSLNSQYLIIYSSDSKAISIYNIKDNVFNSYSNVVINIPDGYSMVELFSSGLNESVIKSMAIDNSNKRNNGGEGVNNKNNNKKMAIIIVSAIISVCIVGLVAGAIFLIIKKRNSRVSFKRLDKDRESHKYPQDNITILLQNYK